jgi:hypothetical protein
VIWRPLVAALALAATPACKAREPSRTPPSARSEGADKTAIFIQIEGPLPDLQGLARIEGLDLQRGAHDLGGGRYRASAFAESKAAVDEVRARGLVVKVIMDEDETKRRMDADHAMMKDAVGDAGT